MACLLYCFLWYWLNFSPIFTLRLFWILFNLHIFSSWFRLHLNDDAVCYQFIVICFNINNHAKSVETMEIFSYLYKGCVAGLVLLDIVIVSYIYSHSHIHIFFVLAYLLFFADKQVRLIIIIIILFEQKPTKCIFFLSLEILWNRNKRWWRWHDVAYCAW